MWRPPQTLQIFRGNECWVIIGVFIFITQNSTQQRDHYGSFIPGVTQNYSLKSLLGVWKKVHMEVNSCGKLQKVKIIQSSFTQTPCRLYSQNQHYTVIFMNITHIIKSRLIFLKLDFISVQAVFPIAPSFLLLVSEFSLNSPTAISRYL